MTKHHLNETLYRETFAHWKLFSSITQEILQERGRRTKESHIHLQKKEKYQKRISLNQTPAVTNERTMQKSVFIAYYHHVCNYEWHQYVIAAGETSKPSSCFGFCSQQRRPYRDLSFLMWCHSICSIDHFALKKTNIGQYRPSKWFYYQRTLGQKKMFGMRTFPL